MSQRAELLALIQKNDPEVVVQFVKNAQQGGADVGEALAECSQRQKEVVWDTLRSLYTAQLLDDPPADGQEADSKKKADCYAFLDCLVTLGAATLANQGDISLPLPQPFVDTAILLHNVLLTLPDEAAAVKHRLAQMFELWWKRGLADRQEIIANTFLYFLRRSHSMGNVCDVKSVWGLHSVLSLVNLETDSASATELKNLLGRCCSSNQYIRTEEGRRFLVFIFTLNCGLLECLHQAVKNQIPYAPKSWLALYGDIYFRAWQKSTGDVCQKIENDCIQDLMNHAIHASREGTQPMSTMLFRVLHQFHRQKKQRGVDAMLLRLYNPILWRSITVPNTEVRAHSAALMLDAFPLQDPDCLQQDCDTIIQRQFDLMQRLLGDPCPVVRALTVEGVCNILGSYLEMIPGEVVQSLLRRLFTELAWDTASPSVRLAVIKGVCLMLDSALCHMLLKPLLPSLSLCVHDKAETVRVAMMELLLKVKAIRSFKYWAIVPIEHLLARLAEDSPPVVRRIVELLFPSFMPLDQQPTEQVSRCLTLLEANPHAARVFFLQAPTHLTLSDTVKYMALLCRYMLENIRLMKRSANDDSRDNDDDANDSKSRRRSRTGVGKKRRDDDQKAQGEGDDKHSNDDDDDDDKGKEEQEEAMSTETLQGLLEAVFLMWTSVSKQLNMAEHSDLKQSIMKKISVTLPEVIKVTQDPKVISLVIEIAGHLPPKAVPTISQGCLSRLRTMPEGNTPGDYLEILEALCLWGMVPNVLQLLSDWLEDSITPVQVMTPPAQPAKKKGKKCVQILMPDREKRPLLALDYLAAMLRSLECKRALLSNHRPLVVKLNRLLSRVLALVEKELQEGREDNSDRRTFLETVLSLHLRLSILLHDPEEEDADCVLYMEKVMRWGERELVPIMLHTTKSEENDDDDGNKQKDTAEARRQLATSCIMLVLNLHSHMLMMGMGDKRQIAPLLSFCRHVLNKASSLAVVDTVLCCLYQAVLFEEVDACGPVSACMSSVMVALNTALHGHCQDSKVLTSIRAKIQGVVTGIIGRHGNLRAGGQAEDVAIVTDLTSTMLSAILAELQHGSRQDLLPSKLEDGQETLPPVTSCVMTCYTRNTPCRRLFMQEIENCIKSGAITDVHTTHAIVHLLLAVHSKAVYHKDVDLASVDSCVKDLVHKMTSSMEGDGHTDEDVYRDVLTTIHSKLQSVVDKAC